MHFHAACCDNISASLSSDFRFFKVIMLRSYAFVDRSVALRHTFSLFRNVVLGH